MKYDFFATWVILILLAVPLSGQTVHIAEGGNGTVSVNWQGEVGWSYFPETSSDLQNWRPMDLVIPSVSGQQSITLKRSGGLNLFRLGTMDLVVKDPLLADFDGDGLDVQTERAWGMSMLRVDPRLLQPGLRHDGVAALWIVDGSGNAGPYRAQTINAAVTQANGGDIIVIREGVYREEVSIQAKQLTLMGYPGERVILDGGGTRWNGISVSMVSGVQLSGITVQGYRKRAVVSNKADLEMRNMLLQECGGGAELVGDRSRWENVIVRRNSGKYPGVLISHGTHKFIHCSIIENRGPGAGGIYVNSANFSTYKRTGLAYVHNSTFWNPETTGEIEINTANPNAHAYVYDSVVRDGDGDAQPDLIVTAHAACTSDSWSGSPLGAPLPGSAALEGGGGQREVPLDFHATLRRPTKSADCGAIEFSGWNPDWLEDADADGLPDNQEYLLGTFPGHWDSDGDGLPDGYEIAIGSDPGRSNFTTDSDGDGFPNHFEIAWGTSITDPESYPVEEYPSGPEGPRMFRVNAETTVGAEDSGRLTLQQSIDAANAGDIILVAAGDYHGGLVITGVGKSILLRFADGSRLVGNGTGKGLHVTQANGLYVYGGRIEGFATGIYGYETSAEFHRVHVVGNTMGINAGNYNAGSPDFYDCVIEGNHGPGPVVKVEAGTSRFVHCTIVGNGKDGDSARNSAVVVSPRGGFSSRPADVKLINSILWNPVYGMELIEGSDIGGSTARVTVTGCLVSDADGDGEGGLQVTPPFVGTLGYPLLDAQLQPLSLGLTHADSTAVPGQSAFDFDGRLRDALRPEVGARQSALKQRDKSKDCELIIEYSESAIAHGFLVRPEIVGITAAEWDMDGDGFFEHSAPHVWIPPDAIHGTQLSFRGYDSNGGMIYAFRKFEDVDGDGLADCWEQATYGTLDFDRSQPYESGASLIVFNPQGIF